MVPGGIPGAGPAAIHEAVATVLTNYKEFMKSSPTDSTGQPKRHKTGSAETSQFSPHMKELCERSPPVDQATGAVLLLAAVCEALHGAKKHKIKCVKDNDMSKACC